MLIAVAVCFVFLAAACQSATGFGFALVLVPLLSLAIDVKAAVAVSLILGPVSAVAALVELRREVRWRVVFGLLAGSLVGAPAGTALLVAASGTTLRVLVAGLILISTVLTVAGVSLREPRRPLAASVAVGAVSGVLRSATSMGGPPVALYLLGLRYDPRAFVATSAAYFLLGSVISVGALATAGRVTGQVLGIALVSLPALLAGNTIGRWLRLRVSERAFRLVVVALLLAAAVAVLLPVLPAAVRTARALPAVI